MRGEMVCKHRLALAKNGMGWMASRRMKVNLTTVYCIEREMLMSGSVEGDDLM